MAKDRARPKIAPTEPSGSPLLAALRRVGHHSEGRLTLLGAAAGAGLLILLFRSNLRHLVHVWSTDENYSHGFLVPLISLYFANEAARRGPVPLRSGVVLGGTLLALSISGKLLSTWIPIGVVADLSLLAGVFGLVALLAGGPAVRQYAFPLAFLAFMIPLPAALYAAIASPLQLLVSRVASDVLNLGGIPVLREGNTMTLPGDIRLFVAEACSGMRQLTGFFALTTAVAYLAARPVWFRLAVVALSIPIAIAANLARVVLTGIIMYHDPRYAVGTFHTVEGLLMMGLGLGLLAIGCKLLGVIAGPSATDRSLSAFRSAGEPAPGRRRGATLVTGPES